MSALLVLGTKAQQGGGGNDDLSFKVIQEALDVPEDQVGDGHEAWGFP